GRGHQSTDRVGLSERQSVQDDHQAERARWDSRQESENQRPDGRGRQTENLRRHQVPDLHRSRVSAATTARSLRASSPRGGDMTSSAPAWSITAPYLSSASTSLNRRLATAAPDMTKGPATPRGVGAADPIGSGVAQACRTPSALICSVIVSPLMTLSPSSGMLKSMPQSLRLSCPVASTPMRVPPHGSLPSPRISTASSIGLVTSLMVRSPVTTKSVSPLRTTPVETNFMVGVVSTLKKSLERRWLSRSAVPVLIEESSI